MAHFYPFPLSCMVIFPLIFVVTNSTPRKVQNEKRVAPQFITNTSQIYHSCTYHPSQETALPAAPEATLQPPVRRDGPLQCLSPLQQRPGAVLQFYHPEMHCQMPRLDIFRPELFFVFIFLNIIYSNNLLLRKIN